MTLHQKLYNLRFEKELRQNKVDELREMTVDELTQEMKEELISHSHEIIYLNREIEKLERKIKQRAIKSEYDTKACINLANHLCTDTIVWFKDIYNNYLNTGEKQIIYQYQVYDLFEHIEMILDEKFEIFTNGLRGKEVLINICLDLERKNKNSKHRKLSEFLREMV